MKIDTDVLFTLINTKLVECHNTLVSTPERHPAHHDALQMQRHYRSLKTSLMNLETFACIEENKSK